MAKAKSWEVTDEFWQRVETLIPLRQRAEDQNYTRKAGGGRQWGLSGFTTQDINRCQTTARAGALVYNWWSWYCRAAHPGARLEAVTSRPLLLAAVGKAANHGGQTQLYLTPLHGKVQTIKALIVNIRAALQHVNTIAEQLPKVDRWATLLRYICQRFAPTITTPSPAAALAGVG
jgi:hypothetical protein